MSSRYSDLTTMDLEAWYDGDLRDAADVELDEPFHTCQCGDLWQAHGITHVGCSACPCPTYQDDRLHR